MSPGLRGRCSRPHAWVVKTPWPAICRCVAAALLALPLAACQTAPVAPPAGTAVAAEFAGYRPRLEGDGKEYRVDAAASQLRIYVFRGGTAARLGHNHVITAPQLQGHLKLPDDPKQAQFSLRVRFDQLQIDDPALRAQTGDAFAGVRSVDDIDGTGRNLRKSVAADRYPEVVVNSLSVAGDWPLLVADIAVTLHGVTRTQPVVLLVRRGASALQIRGSFAIRQSDFGIKPFSVLGGVMAVQDALAIEFELSAVADQ